MTNVLPCTRPGAATPRVSPGTLLSEARYALTFHDPRTAAARLDDYDRVRAAGARAPHRGDESAKRLRRQIGGFTLANSCPNCARQSDEFADHSFCPFCEKADSRNTRDAR